MSVVSKTLHSSGIVECDFSAELKNHSFPHICLYELFLCFDVEEPVLEFCLRILAIPYKKEKRYICRQSLSAKRNENGESNDLSISTKVLKEKKM
jgi:hypothetical protein